MSADKNRDLLSEYEEFTKEAFLKPDEETQEVRDFLRKVLGPDLQRWSDRWERYACTDEDETEED